MVSGLSRLLEGLARGVGDKRRSVEGRVSIDRLREACIIERILLARGLSIDDINYYAMPGHEVEALEAYGEEVLEAILKWREVMEDVEETSACKLLEKLETSQKRGTTGL